MASIEELKAAASAAASSLGATEITETAQQVTPVPTSAPVPISLKRVFRHPVAGSTTIMPNGNVLVFVGPMAGQGDKRFVGEGLIETEDAAEISWLESLAKMRTTQITEVTITAEGSVVGATKPQDPAIQLAVIDAAANTLRATTEVEVAKLQENFGTVIGSTAGQ